MSEGDLAVRLESVGKAFARRHVEPFLLRRVWPAAGSPRPPAAAADTYWALRDLDLEVAAGESVAVVGENGSGKSTLLALVAGALWPTTGLVSVRGRVGPVLALGVGFQADMTAPENAFIGASLLGLAPDAISARMNDILAFADLGDFVNVPIRHFSAGMVARLAFAVAVHLDAEVLLVDEVLAVGDGAFQEKCLQRIADLQKNGTMLLFATHDLAAARRVCTRGVWLKGGRVESDAPLAACLERYESFLHARS